MVDGERSEDVSVVSCVPQGSLLGPLLFSLYTCDLLMIQQNALVDYADDSTLLTEVSKSGSRVAVILSLNRDHARIVDWCKRWGMLVNIMIAKALVISRPRTLAPFFRTWCWMVL